MRDISEIIKVPEREPGSCIGCYYFGSAIKCPVQSDGRTVLCTLEKIIYVKPESNKEAVPKTKLKQYLISYVGISFDDRNYKLGDAFIECENMTRKEIEKFKEETLRQLPKSRQITKIIIILNIIKLK